MLSVGVRLNLAFLLTPFMCRFHVQNGLIIKLENQLCHLSLFIRSERRFLARNSSVDNSQNNFTSHVFQVEVADDQKMCDYLKNYQNSTHSYYEICEITEPARLRGSFKLTLKLCRMRREGLKFFKPFTLLPIYRIPRNCLSL